MIGVGNTHHRFDDGHHHVADGVEPNSKGNIKMVPYSLSACQVVRVFCAVLRALGTSPIMSLEIVFLTGYPTVKLLCNAISFSLLFHSLLLNIT